MKICFIDSYFKGMYGAPKSMLSLAKGLSSLGIDIVVASSKDDLLLQEVYRAELGKLSLDVPDELLISRKKIKILDRIKYVLSLVSYWIKINGRSEFDHVDHICVNDIRSFLLFLPILYKQRRKVTWYVRINDRVPIVHSLALFLSSKVILISTDCKESFTRLERKLFNKKFFVLNTGFNFESTIDSEHNIKINHASKDIVFTNVGSICSRKNQIGVIKAFSGINITNKHLYMIGSPASEIDEKYYEETLKLVESLSLQDNVTFIEHTPYVLSYLKMSNYFLFASHKEGLPRVVIEAVMSGCYVISSNVDGISDILIDTNLGAYSEYKANDERFDSSFLELIHNSLNSSSENRPDLESFHEKFSYNKYIEGFIKVISS